MSGSASCERVFAPGGPLSRLLPGYAPRAAQRAMAAAVEEAVSECGTLICEAGTGTGKTLAYLVPAVAGGGRIVVSTGTRHLQDRLLERDLPLVCRALECTPRVALLKGRSNYLCRWRYEQVLTSARLVARQVAARVARLSGWAAQTVSGDLAEVGDLSETDPRASGRHLHRGQTASGRSARCSTNAMSSRPAVGPPGPMSSWSTTIFCSRTWC